MSARDDTGSRSISEFYYSRRRFVQGVAAAGVVAAFDRPTSGDKPDTEPAVLTGDRFDLVIESVPVNLTGKRSIATAINSSSPGPTLRWREGDTVTLTVTNRLTAPTSIHWHGIRCPAEMDGVPGLSFAGIAPNQTFVYRIPVLQNGTYWYHSHSRFQEQTGLVGALIIDPREKDPIDSERDYVMLLTDWTDTNPDTVFANLKKQSDYYNYQKRTAGTFFSDARANGLNATISDRLAWGRANMSPTDLADVTSATYTYLINGKPPAANWTGLFEPGQRVRLRFINASAMTFFDIRIPGLKMDVVQADGNAVHPVRVDEFRFGPAETYDVIVQPTADLAYTIFAQPLSRSGFARGTLAPRLGMAADIPKQDPLPKRTMVDMGMDMKGMTGMKGMKTSDKPGMQNMAGMDGMDMKQTGMPGMQAGTGMKDPMQDKSMSSMKMDSPADAHGHDMSSMDMHHTASMGSMEKIGTQPFPQPGPQTRRFVPMASDAAPQPKVETRQITVGPSVAMVAQNTTPRLSDPGDGLNGNGRRVLTYADLRARYPGVDGRAPSREIELHLSGNMERYIWGFDGYRFSEAEPVHLKLGERVRIVLINDTMMEHPIHLHGLWGELENGHGEFLPFKHTITVKPAERLSYLVSADTPGRWAYHCHLLYHMKAGMFRAVIVS
jgi:CopA family copper-resistance protein